MRRPISSRPLRWITYLFMGGVLVALSLNRVSAPEAHAAASVSIFALTTNNTLVKFNSATPGTIISTVPLFGPSTRSTS